MFFNRFLMNVILRSGSSCGAFILNFYWGLKFGICFSCLGHH